MILSKWKTLSLEELKQYPDALNDLRIKKTNGFIIKNLLSIEETKLIIDQFENLPNSLKVKIPEGATYPKVFPQLVSSIPGSTEEVLINDQVFTEYFNNSEIYNRNFTKEFNYPMTKKLKEVFAMISGNRKIEIPKGFNSSGEYVFGTIRKLIPNSGNISFHCGNYFQQEFPEFYNHLSKQVDVFNQLSYFVVLDTPQIGGELSIYNWHWQDGQTKAHPAENIIVKDAKGNSIEIKTIKKEKLDLSPGDLVLFQGGSIWHRIEEIKGKKSRYTLGGFIGRSKDDKAIYIWS
tara:strand:+ start:1147 stop:2019 length:873 start_codon:yes stop_codon:yes gene_type:complete